MPGFATRRFALGPLLLLAMLPLVVARAATAATFFNSFATISTNCTAACSGVVDDQGTGAAFAALAERGISSTASAGAGIGYVRAFASVIVRDDPDDASGHGTATAEGEFADRFVIDGGALNGTIGEMDFFVGIGGGGLSASSSSDLSIRPFPAASASFRASISLGQERVPCSDCSVFVGTSGDASGGPVTGPVGETLRFVFGAPIDLFVEALATVAVYGDGQALADFANTVEWGGITEVRDAVGNVIVGFGVSSDSGVDWSQPVVAPVPEPAVALLLGAGAALLAPGSRRPRFADR